LNHRFFYWGVLGRPTEKALLQDATLWAVQAITPTTNANSKKEKLSKGLGGILSGGFTFLIIFLMPIGNTIAQEVMNNPFAGKVLYQTHCLRCHGSLGDGKGPDAGMLTVPPRDFHTSESTAKNEYELRSIIIWGLVFSPMHGWGHRLTPQEIRDLISYIRELAPYQPHI
jgi:cytochrome c553